MTTIKRKLKKKPGWYFIVALILVVGGYGSIKTVRNIYKVWCLSRMMRAEEKALDEAVKRIESLEKELERLTNDSTYIEKIAREEYGMIKKGEEVYRISLPDTGKKVNKNGR